jgi:hypothetical protein
MAVEEMRTERGLGESELVPRSMLKFDFGNRTVQISMSDQNDRLQIPLTIDHEIAETITRFGE